MRNAQSSVLVAVVRSSLSSRTNSSWQDAESDEQASRGFRDPGARRSFVDERAFPRPDRALTFETGDHVSKRGHLPRLRSASDLGVSGLLRW